METDEKKYNPLIVFRIKAELSQRDKNVIAEIIKQGVKDGCIIMESSVDVLAFNVSGDMVYPPPL